MLLLHGCYMVAEMGSKCFVTVLKSVLPGINTSQFFLQHFTKTGSSNDLFLFKYMSEPTLIYFNLSEKVWSVLQLLPESLRT